MPQRTPTIKMNVDEWSESFQKALDSKNLSEIQALIGTLPTLDSQDQMKQILLQTMDAEMVLHEIRVHLLEKREKLISDWCT